MDRNSNDVEPLILLPLEVMVKPLELRFKYHFDGDRPTNKLDKVGEKALNRASKLTGLARVFPFAHCQSAKHV